MVEGDAMDRQSVSFRERLKANRFASTLVILATLSLGILIGTVVSAGVKGKEKGASSSDATPTAGSFAAAAIEPVFADIPPA